MAQPTCPARFLPRSVISTRHHLRCELLGLMGVRECYVIDAANATTLAWVSTQKHLRGLAANTAFWVSTLRHTMAASVLECSGRGVFAPPMPVHGAPPVSEHPRCLCYAGFAGRRCEIDASRRPLRACLNGCSGRGTCVRNWCHCNPGHYGVDCSLGAGGGMLLPPPIGAQDAGDTYMHAVGLLRFAKQSQTPSQHESLRPCGHIRTRIRTYASVPTLRFATCLCVRTSAAI